MFGNMCAIVTVNLVYSVRNAIKVKEKGCSVGKYKSFGKKVKFLA